ncbi:UbiD family decarboxylase [Natrarchaeobius halalkaliphilus]|uniref:Anhydromevalonate phosphate decarboxylase n=1 Tax=Natrarchaeobius halalkaliphilus TaxID=1679091 RepID=A0A3N6M073_9EURY|nr:UbiD family decarboxylase [Natrarchaeobius halalkaliphilus]RQG87924.1 UbiD family decarboxylase [Natrarchaeobius halalkaliphilus]
MRDLRSYLETLPDSQLERVSKSVNPAEFDVTAILQNLENEDRYPAVLFENPTDIEGRETDFRLISNVFADRRRIAQALDLSTDEWRMETSLEYGRRETNRQEPVVVDTDDAPVMEDAVPDLTHLPVVRHHRLDPAPYINMTPTMKDPESGVYNVAFLRNMVKGGEEMGIHMSPRHNFRIYKTNEDRGERTRMAVTIGHHPSYYLGALTLAGFEVDEYDVIGGMFGDPLRLTPSKTWGDEFLVPADAEVIVEAEVLPEVRETEAPFGEFPGYYGPQRLKPVVEVKNVVCRSDPIFQHVFVGHKDVATLGGVPKEGGIYNDIQGRVPSVEQVHLPSSGCGRFRCYVSLEQTTEGEAKHAALQALASSDFIKHVVVVDEDVDAFDEEEVLWAQSTRVRADEDIDIINGVKGNTLDPSVRGEVATSKIIIDATKPVDEQYPPVLDIPEDALERMTLTEYLD